MKHSLLSFLAAALFLGGCTYPIVDLRKAEPAIQCCSKAAKTTLAVSGVDARDDVRARLIEPNYVGSLRDIFAIPYHLNTVQRQSAVNQLTEAVAAGYSKAGYKTDTVLNPNVVSRATAIAALKKTDARRFVLVTVNELYSNTLFRTEINYSVTLEVLNRSGSSLAKANALVEEKVLGSASVVPFHYAKTLIPLELGAALTDLAANPSIKAALK